MATGWYVVEPPTSGIFAAAKAQPARASLLGEASQNGSLAVSVKAALANFQGGQFVSGVDTMLAKRASASLNGIFYNNGALAATAKRASAAMAGKSENRATLAATIAKATMALNGSQTAIGVIAATAAKATAALGKILTQNFLSNGDFEQGQTPNWGGWNAAIVLDNTVSHNGSNSGRVTVPIDNSNQQLTCNVPGPIYPGDYLVGFWSKNEKPATQFGIQISYIPQAGGARVLWGPSGGGNWNTTNNIAVANAVNDLTWVYREVQINVPETTSAAGLQIGFKRNGGSIGEAYSGWIDELSVRQYLDANSALGNMPVTLQTAKAAMAGQQGQSGILAGMLKPIGAAMGGVEHPMGIMADAAKPATAAMNGQQNMVATFAAALKVAQAAFVSEQGQVGAAEMTAKAASFAGASVSPITVNSIGAYVRNAPNSSNFNVVVNISVVEGNNRRLIVPIHVSHANWLSGYNSGKPSATSSLDGALSLVSGAIMMGNSSGNRQGSVTVYELINPSVGDHVITINIAASQAVGSMGAQPICFNEVVGRGTPVTQAITGTVAAQNIPIPTVKETDMVFIASVIDNPGFTLLTGEWATTGGIFCNKQGLSTSGEGDWLYAAYSQGDGTTKTFSATASVRHASIGFNLLGP